MFALVDCNNFYVSCERAFNPRLENKPVVVLSNNDGCIISRSNEAKKLAIPMGAPFFKWKKFCADNAVQVLSSNYELYGDMSHRVMSLLKEHNEKMEIYSIDEAFLSLSPNGLSDDMIHLRQIVKQGTGIPISIGVASTKTLAKAANYFAKNSSSGVFFLTTAEQQEEYLTQLHVGKIWGIGFNLSQRLQAMGLLNANQLRHTDSKKIRLHFSVTVEKTVKELQGVPCIGLEMPQPRKQIISSRSFGKKVTALDELEEAVSHYITIASGKLRKQHSVAAALHVFLQTNRFKPGDTPYENAMTFPFPSPTADTRYLIHVAKKCVKQLYKKNSQYHKAGVMLMDISPAHLRQSDMFTETIDVKSEQLMARVDQINQIMGKNTVFFAAEGIKRPWLIRCDRRTPRYTTRWAELLQVYIR